MLTELCAEIRNYFLVDGGIHHGDFKISGGSIAPLPFLKEGQYFRIVGSAFNDGVHQYPVADLIDESFTGAVWEMAVPPAVISLADDISSYVSGDAAKPSAYASESFGGYTYSKATGANGAPLSWEQIFASRLNKYRRYSVL